MSKKLIIILSLLIAIGVGLFLVKDRLVSKLTEIKTSGETAVNQIKKEISAPPPLRSSRQTGESYLAQPGVIKRTNIQRANNGLEPLAENNKLDYEAQLKVQDMFTNQYFEHVSPVTGKGAGNLVESVGYQYITVGENLALGNYKDDQDLVQAWMNSPGHRANILNVRYTEIGVAVMQGTFEGHKTWLAVQTFALPLSACPQPDVSLKLQIATTETQIDQLKSEAEAKLNELNNTEPKHGPAYNQKADEYNALVNQINTLVGQLKAMVNQYNSQITTFNACVAG